MRQKIKRFVLVLALMGLIVGLFAAVYAQANSSFSDMTQSQADSINAPTGPEADPHLRHVPGGYDYENDPPQNDVQ